MRRASILAVVLAACSYGPLNTQGTSFMCDGTHACPPGQSCVDGMCTGSGSGTGTGSSDTPVVCMSTTCGSGSGCCYDGVDNHCAAGSSSCTGAFAACTSAANCGADQLCCNPEAPVCGNASCSGSGVACTSASDCPTDKPMCCMDLGPLPWGQCEPVC